VDRDMAAGAAPREQSGLTRGFSWAS
jgi:hypothetical protein